MTDKITAIVGIKDTMSTIQSKLNKGGLIWFTKGTYKITKQLVIPPNTTIDLRGSTLQRKASIQSIFINKVSKSVTKYNGAGNITIMNGTFEGMGGYSYDNLLTFFHSYNVKILACTFKDILCHGIELNSSKNCVINECKFLGYNLENKDNSFRECIQLDHAGFSALVISGSTKNSKCYDGTCCTDVEISNCLFTKSAYRDYPYVAIGEHSQLRGNYKHKGIKIHDNEIHCKKNPELIQAAISITSMEDVEVYNNTFDCSRVARIYSKDYSYNLKGTKVTAQDGDGICKNVTIKNNTISGCTSSNAFKQYNKSGSTNHSKIIKKPNKYV